MRTTEEPKNVSKNYRFTEKRSSDMKTLVKKLQAQGVSITETDLVEQGVDLMLHKLAIKYRVSLSS
jgi:hypothetical protein